MLCLSFISSVCQNKVVSRMVDFSSQIPFSVNKGDKMNVFTSGRKICIATQRSEVHEYVFLKSLKNTWYSLSEHRPCFPACKRNAYAIHGIYVYVNRYRARWITSSFERTNLPHVLFSVKCHFNQTSLDIRELKIYCSFFA